MLRPYQQQAIDAVRAAYLRKARAVLLVLPTGGGKTLTASTMVEAAVAKGKRVLWLAGRRELIDQAAAAMPVTAGVSMDGRAGESTSTVEVALSSPKVVPVTNAWPVGATASDLHQSLEPTAPAKEFCQATNGPCAKLALAQIAPAAQNERKRVFMAVWRSRGARGECGLTGR